MPHTGIDVTPARKGDTSVEILSVYGGNVVETGHDPEAGLYVLVYERDGHFWGYGHNSRNLVSKGDRVSEGEPLALIGATGGAKGVHCHIWRAPTLEAARRVVHGLTNLKRGRTTAAWAASMGGLTDPHPAILASLVKAPAATPAKSAAELEEDELMKAADLIVSKITAYVDARVKDAESRLRADGRGWIFLDAGPDGTLRPEQARHAVLISREGPLVLEVPAEVGLRQIESLRATGDGVDYRWIDSTRYLAPLRTDRFVNRVKDALTASNYFGDDRQVSREEAWAWIEKHEAAKRAAA